MDLPDLFQALLSIAQQLLGVPLVFLQQATATVDGPINAGRLFGDLKSWLKNIFLLLVGLFLVVDLIRHAARVPRNLVGAFFDILGLVVLYVIGSDPDAFIRWFADRLQ